MPDTAEPIATESGEAALWEDFVDIFVTPREVFRRRRDRPRWFWAMIFITVLTGLLFFGVQYAIQPVFDAGFDQIARDRPEVTPEQIEQMRAMSRTFGPISTAAIVPILIILSGLMIWLVGGIFGSVAPLPAAFMIATYSQFPRIFQEVVLVVQGLVMDMRGMISIAQLSLSPARLMDPSTPEWILGIVGRIDPFLIWSLVVVAIGLQVIGGLSRKSSAIAAALLWIVGCLPIFLGAFSQ